MQTVAAGSTVMFDIVVESNTFLSGVVVTDPLCDTLTGPTGDTNTNNILEPTETWVYICTVNNVTADFTNTATVTGTPPTGPDITDTDTADVTVESPGMVVTKTPPTQTVVSGGTANFTITAQNTGNVALSGVVIDDPLCDSLTGPTGDTNTNSILDVGETWSWACTVNNVTADFTNTATVTGTPPTGPDVTDTDTADVTVLPADTPLVEAVKDSVLSADNDSSGSVTAGDNLLYTIVLGNIGDGDALDVIFTDTPDPNTTLVVGTVTTTQGTVTQGNGAGETAVTVDIGTLPALVGEATVSFEVQIDDPVPPGVTEIVNQGVVSGSNFTDVPTDDPNSNPDDDPTTTTLGPPIQEIPTLSEWGLIAFCLLLFLAAGRVLRGGATAER